LTFQMINTRNPDDVLPALSVNYRLKKGNNLIHPNQAIETGTLREGSYAWEVRTVGTIGFNENFKLGGVKIEVEVGRDGVVTVNDRDQAKGLGLQDLIDLTET
jgi:hypothetical protein